MNDERPGVIQGRLIHFGLILLLIVTAVGCAGQRPSLSTGHASKSNQSVFDRQAAVRELDEARRMVDSGQYDSAIPRLLLIMSGYPASEPARDARYLLAVSYYKVGNYRDAMDLFNEYLKTTPEGKYAEDSSAYMARLKQEYDQRFFTPEKLDQRIDTLMQQVKEHPDDVGCQQELADLLWKRGDYEEAGRLYDAIIEKDPAFVEEPLIKARFERLANGNYILLTPQEILRRAVAEKPLEVINVASFRSGQDLFTREHRFYVVTGQVLNRGDSVLCGVKVYVTIYGVGNVVFDTRTVNIGRVNPAEMRAFSVRFSTFDNIENIYRHECVATFQR